MKAIWAQTPAGVIGQAGKMPWDLPEDLARFARLTRGGAVIMGRRTWDSLPSQGLPGRTSIVLTRDTQWSAPDATTVRDLPGLAAVIADLPTNQEPWLIGGGQIYALLFNQVTQVERTIVNTTADGDTYAPTLGPDFKLVTAAPSPTTWRTSRTGLTYRFETWIRHDTTDAGPI